MTQVRPEEIKQVLTRTHPQLNLRESSTYCVDGETGNRIPKGGFSTGTTVIRSFNVSF